MGYSTLSGLYPDDVFLVSHSKADLEQFIQKLNNHLKELVLRFTLDNSEFRMTHPNKIVSSSDLPRTKYLESLLSANSELRSKTPW